ncbi:MAG TPA: patatin-like phospholipase family protein, partial [Polyangia bacterium]
MSPTEPRIGLVLPGGAALGAYEAGVVDYVVRELGGELGSAARPDVLCGTSVGAIGAAMLGAFADEPRVAAARLVELWTNLRVERFLRPDVLGALASLCGCRAVVRRPGVGGLLDTRQIDRLVRDAIPFARIGANVRRGLVSAVGITTTHVASGHTVVFVESDGPIRHWSRDRTLVAQPARIGAEHVLASAAIPLLFPAIAIGGELYCEGGLRLNVPLSPAVHLGADRLLVVSPNYVAPPDARLARARERALSGPVFLLGRMLNALLLDRIDADIERLHQVNDILAAARPRATATATATEPRLRIVQSLVVRASRSIGIMAADYVRAPGFARRGIVPRLLKQIAAAEGTAEADLVSYLLFDGDFAAALIALGRRDARAQHDA